MATELGKAYVQIVPSAQGIKSALTGMFDEETDGLGERVGRSLGQKLAGTLKSVIAAAGIGKVISDSLNIGGALQQSLGGVETLFKANADTVKEYAAQAYQTVGLSANDYMETTTSFAASLLSSVSQDTNAAAQLANMAMVDMADNANKMGTDMQSVQNAYQGFAKQNYTMLDNLKLGYGGTQAEMQRLLNDATRISGVKYDLGNLADMYSAIHIIQQEMDITGTTAREAATTLTGSFASMKAAAENVLGNWSAGADLTQPLQALADTAQTFLVGNLLPMVGNVLTGIPQIVSGLVPQVMQTLYTIVPQALQAGTEMLTSLAQGFAQGIPEFLSTALPQLLSFTDELRANAGSFVDAGLNLITQLANGLIAGLPDLIAYVPDIVINICGIINDNMPKIISTGVELIAQLVVGIAKAVPDLLANWKKILQAVLSVISAVNWLNIGQNILTGIADGIKSMGTNLLNAFKSAFSHPLEWLASLPKKMLDFGKSILQSFTNGLTGKNGVVNLLTIGNMANSADSGSTSNSLSGWADANLDLGSSAATMADISIPAYEKSGNAATNAAKKAKNAAKTAASVVNSYSDTVTELVGNVTRTTQTTNEELSDGTKQLKTVVTETSRQLVNGVLKDIKTITTTDAKGKTTVQQTMETVRETALSVTSTFDSIVNGIATSTKTITETLTDGTETTKQVVTETYDDIVNGALVTVEKVTNIAADGTKQVSETIKKSSADSFSGLLKGWQDEANKGVTGTFSTLVNAVKNQDWLSVGEWVISTLYNGLAPETKQLIDDFGKQLIQQVNSKLGDWIGEISNGLWDAGSQLFNGTGSTSPLQGITDGVTKNGSVIMDVLSQIGTSMGALATGAGNSIAGLASSMGGLGGIASSLGGILGQLGSMILSNPILAAIIVIGAVAGGIGLALWASSRKEPEVVSHYKSPFEGSSVYDSLSEFSTRAAMQYRVTGQRSAADKQTSILERIEGLLDEHLPDIGTGQVVMDSGELVGVISPRMATNVDARIGVVATRKARGV